jgi:hypothetical protein
MSDKYVVVLDAGTDLPERDYLISNAWGDAPVSYVQDEVAFNECSFLDLKVNKWEVNNEWSKQQVSEPWIRIEKVEGEVLNDFLLNEGSAWPKENVPEKIITIELDEGGSEVDEILLQRLIAVFFGRFKVYRCSDRIEEVSQGTIDTIPTLDAIHERIRRCL